MHVVLLLAGPGGAGAPGCHAPGARCRRASYTDYRRSHVSQSNLPPPRAPPYAFHAAYSQITSRTHSAHTDVARVPWPLRTRHLSCRLRLRLHGCAAHERLAMCSTRATSSDAGGYLGILGRPSLSSASRAPTQGRRSAPRHLLVTTSACAPLPSIAWAGWRLLVRISVPLPPIHPDAPWPVPLAACARTHW